jgi:NAD(P)-dependent dehydrogenase (short-subunit alcohol dehydrogenase family)
MRLEGKICIVTGGGSGIGRATCLLFAKEGARVAVADKRKEAADAVAAECTARDAQAIGIAVDVAKDADAKRMVEETVKRFGRLDVLVNNAGYGFAGTVVDTDEEAWDDLMAVNVRGVFLCSKHAIPAMAANGGGAIVNTASVGALTGNPGIGSYIASKHGVVGLTRTAALEYVKRGIRVNAVNPGLIDTQIARDVVDRDEQAYAELAKHVPIGRAGRPEEIASVVLWLCSPGASYVVGHALTVDGGMTVP